MPKLNIEYLQTLLKQRTDLNVLQYFTEKTSTLYLYLKCIDAVKRFRETHWTFVKEYLIKAQKVPMGSSGIHPTRFIVVPIEAIVNKIHDMIEARPKEGESEEERELFEKLEKKT